MRRLSITVLVVLAISGCLTLRADLAFASDAEPDTSLMSNDEFAQTFTTDSYVANTIAALDTLRAQALTHIYDGFGELMESDLPEVRTSSDVLMVYSVTSEAGTVYHQFSVSRAPFLADAFGKWLIGMACLRFGLPAPTEILVSPMGVFHAEWKLTPRESESVAVAATPARPESMFGFSGEALILTASTELRLIDFDYDEIREAAEGRGGGRTGESAN